MTLFLLETLSTSNQCHSTYFPAQHSAIRRSLYQEMLDFVLEKLPPNTPFHLEFSERLNTFPANNGSLVETILTAKLFVSTQTKNSIFSTIDCQYEVLGEK